METPESNFDPKRTAPVATRTNHRQGLAFVLILVFVLAATAYFFHRQSPREQITPAPVIADMSLPPQAQVGESSNTATETADAINPDQSEQTPDAPQNPRPPLPSLADSDTFLRDHWQELGLPEMFASWTEGEFIFQRLVAFIDGLSRGEVLQKLTPLNQTKELRPESAFKTVKAEGIEWLDEPNFKRYNGAIVAVTALDAARIADLTRWFRPLLESAFQQLGQSPELFSGRLLKGIDLMLATPDVEGPIALKRESVYYQFADPQLEALPNSQKLLVRIGPDNRQRIKDWLAAYKQAFQEAD